MYIPAPSDFLLSRNCTEWINFRGCAVVKVCKKFRLKAFLIQLYIFKAFFFLILITLFGVELLKFNWSFYLKFMYFRANFNFIHDLSFLIAKFSFF